MSILSALIYTGNKLECEAEQRRLEDEEEEVINREAMIDDKTGTADKENLSPEDIKIEKVVKKRKRKLLKLKVFNLHLSMFKCIPVCMCMLVLFQ